MLKRKRARRAMKYHEAANIFPLMEGEEFKALMADIRTNGQREPIWTYRGAILDGRNRYSAILRLQEQKVAIEPKFREWDGAGDPVAFVVSLNLHRRHLNESQRAMIAAKAATLQICKVPQAVAAKQMNVSPRSVADGVKVTKHGDIELVKAVESGALPVSTAAKAVDAAERYPQIARVVSRPQDRAAVAENLDRLPEPERERKIAAVVKGDSDTLTQLANKPPMPKKRPATAEDSWRDFFDEAERALDRLGAHGTFARYVGGWECEQKEWFLARLRNLIETLNAVEDAAIGSMSYDEGTAGTTSEGTVH